MRRIVFTSESEVSSVLADALSACVCSAVSVSAVGV